MHRCQKMSQKVHNAAALKAFHDSFKFDHKTWNEVAQEYTVQRLFFYQQLMGKVGGGHRPEQSVKQFSR
jgi:Cys-tRNA synthase (O-phospho-L-seryl-tRNA:Cys-tRNA synthase)